MKQLSFVGADGFTAIVSMAETARASGCMLSRVYQWGSSTSCPNATPNFTSFGALCLELPNETGRTYAPSQRNTPMNMGIHLESSYLMVENLVSHRVGAC